MNKKALLLGSVFAALAFAPQAMAEPSQGWYAAFDLGYHWPDDVEMSSSGTASDGNPYEYDFGMDGDVAGFARLGYRLNENWRLELEGGSRTSDIADVAGNPARPLPNSLCSVSSVLPACNAPEGSIQSYTLMANLIYDFMPDATLNPYVGFGIGINRLEMDLSARANSGAGVIGVHDKDSVFAYQWLAGVSWEATDRLNVDVTYRYLNGAEADWESQDTFVFPVEGLSAKYVDHSLSFGLRYAFGEEAAPPPPPPPPP
ncbi:MAG TPA: outer membrane beta-barrel protein, partial [Caulobacter sp.]|nr:outer membrane beta-barrel protein [Caulobacter sp.]